MLAWLRSLSCRTKRCLSELNRVKKGVSWRTMGSFIQSNEAADMRVQSFQNQQYPQYDLLMGVKGDSSTAVTRVTKEKRSCGNDVTWRFCHGAGRLCTCTLISLLDSSSRYIDKDNELSQCVFFSIDSDETLRTNQTCKLSSGPQGPLPWEF